jgi:hypothetical protein
MVAKLPISRIVSVTVTRQDRFPTREGFGTPLILVPLSFASDSDSASYPINATVRTKVYGSMEEVADDWDAADSAYQAMQVAFSQNPRPLQVKIGYIDLDSLGDANALTDELDAVYDYDGDWYWLLHTEQFRDLPSIDAIIEWTETKNKQFLTDSNDPLMVQKMDTTNVAARNKGGAYERTSVWWHNNPEKYLAIGAASWAARRNFDQVNTAYTLKFKRIATINDINLGSASVQAITGFVPELGLDPDEGHLANTYVNIGSLDMVVEGNTLSGAFVDEIHTADWLIARTQESILAVLANNARVPYTNTGVHMIVAACEAVMQRAFVAGLIADVEDVDTGELLPAYDFEVERVEEIPEAQRRHRIAPDIRGTFRYAGALHYVTVHYTMRF